jgi:hypothetical protein
MRYKPKSIAALNIALGGLPAQMRVEVESGDELARKFGNHDATGTLSRKRGESKQDQHGDTHVA